MFLGQNVVSLVRNTTIVWQKHHGNWSETIHIRHCQNTPYIRRPQLTPEKTSAHPMSRDVVQLWSCGRCGDTFRSEKAAKQHQGKRVREPMTPLSALLAGF